MARLQNTPPRGRSPLVMDSCPGVLPYSLGGRVPLGLRKSYWPFTTVNFATFETLHQSTLSILFYHNFCPLSDRDPVKRTLC